MNGILTTSQVAKTLGITGETVRRMLRDGILKGFKIGGYAKRRHWRVKQQDLEAFMNGQASAGSEHTEASK